jgi:uncharacterized protein
MPDHDTSEPQDLEAGEFSAWMNELDEALCGKRASDVPCDGCTACCTASQFIHIGPDETDTLAHIPKALLFPAPGLPRGHVLLGYDDRGRCPLLVDDRCSIYAHRPRTCRTYDCRVFPAAGLVNDDDARIARQARRWRFRFASEAAKSQHDAVRAAATFLHERIDLLPAELVPVNTTQRAVLALRIHTVFLQRDADGHTTVVEPDPEVVRAEVVRCAGARRTR